MKLGLVGVVWVEEGGTNDPDAGLSYYGGAYICAVSNFLSCPLS